MAYMLILTVVVFSFFSQPNICARAQDVPAKAKDGASEKDLVNVNNLNSQLQEQAKMLHIKSQEAQDMKNELRNTRQIIDGLNNERIDLKKENQTLQEKVDSLEETLKNERSGFYQELGAAYAGSGNFEKAIEAYNRSLQYAPDNTRVYYYLGLLYKHHLDESQKAVDNFKKYLKYNPEAKDKDEVEYFIKMMSN